MDISDCSDEIGRLLIPHSQGIAVKRIPGKKQPDAVVNVLLIASFIIVWMIKQYISGYLQEMGRQEVDINEEYENSLEREKMEDEAEKLINEYGDDIDTNRFKSVMKDEVRRKMEKIGISEKVSDKVSREICEKVATYIKNKDS